MMDEFDFGKTEYHLKEIMDEKGISLKQLAHDIGVSYGTIEKYYSNSVKRFDVKNMTKICYYLNVDYGDIFTYVPPVDDE